MAEMKLRGSYDAFADVLYLSLGPPAPAVSMEDEWGLVWRYLNEAGEPFGVTVLDFQDCWVAYNGDLIDRLSNRLKIEPHKMRETITQLTEVSM